MKTIEMDIATVSLLADHVPQNKLSLLNYDSDEGLLSGPENIIGDVEALDLPAIRKAALLAYASARRYTVEGKGIEMEGIKIATDRQSQSMLSSAYNMAAKNASFTTMWKGSDGKFTELNAATIMLVADAVGNYVASCFAAEAAVASGINSGNITTREQIDAALNV